MLNVDNQKLKSVGRTLRLIKPTLVTDFTKTYKENTIRHPLKALCSEIIDNSSGETMFLFKTE